MEPIVTIAVDLMNGYYSNDYSLFIVVTFHILFFVGVSIILTGFRSQNPSLFHLEYSVAVILII